MSPEWSALLALHPLALAAGVDLYVTLLFLGMAGRFGWEAPAPGGLEDLAVPPVLALAALLYAVERWMESRPVRSLCWNAVHTIVRPVAAALLAHLALADLPVEIRLWGAAGTGALALAVHVTRSGWNLFLPLLPVPGRVRFLFSLAEDVAVLALLSLLLDAPLAAAALAVVATGMGLARGRSGAEAFLFGLRMLKDGAGALLRDRRWHGPERFPRWIRKAVEDTGLVTGVGLRGSPAAAVNLPGLGAFRRGWVVVRGGSPVFLYRSLASTRSVDLGAARSTALDGATLHTRVELGGGEGGPFALCFALDGPGPEALAAEFPRGTPA